jgi:alkylation response protein AidB-like acyl-CoA dehydrogenase
MDFSFTSEQDDLRREARTFLEANPAPSQEQLSELGWVGVIESESFLEAAVLFEELGRVLYDGPYIENEVGDDRRQQLAAHALEAVGIGSRAVEMAVAYIGEREQFGKKIGTYQAVSHPVVDSYVAIELARSLAYWAALCVATGDDQADVACAAANTQATEAAVRA